VSEIGAASRGWKACLRRAVPVSSKKAPDGKSNLARQIIGLVEAAAK
jgi:hypothetical protein